MQTLTGESVVERLAWRYAVKKFDPARKIAPPDWDALERALLLTPSSFGLQPWRFVVVADPAVREKLVAASWNQRQVVDASHVVVFAIQKDVGPTHVDAFVRRTAEVRGVPVESLDGYRKMMLGFLARPKPEFDVNAWAALQVYIALGSFMTAAAVMGIDTCPMEGIVPSQYDGILGFAEKGLATTVVCCAGYRAADDRYATAQKVRFERGDVILRA
jgi:nitroreductase